MEMAMPPMFMETKQRINVLYIDYTWIEVNVRM